MYRRPLLTPYIGDNESDYNYYKNQIGGYDVYPNYFRGYVGQKGYGLFGALFKPIFRTITKSAIRQAGKTAVSKIAGGITKHAVKRAMKGVAKTALKSVRDEALKTGVNILSDAIQNKGNLKQAIRQGGKKHISRAGRNVIHSVKRRLYEDPHLNPKRMKLDILGD